MLLSAYVTEPPFLTSKWDNSEFPKSEQRQCSQRNPALETVLEQISVYSMGENSGDDVEVDLDSLNDDMEEFR